MNTDDRTVIEFGFARGLGEGTTFKAEQIIALANRRGEFAPARVRGAINWNGVLLNRATDVSVDLAPPYALPDYAKHHDFAVTSAALNFAGARELWMRSRFAPVNAMELRAIAVALADGGDELAASAAERLRPWSDAEAEAILGALRTKQGRYAEAVPHVLRAFGQYRTDAWPDLVTMGRLFDAAAEIASHDPSVARAMFDAVDKPFAAGQWEDARRYYRIFIAGSIEQCGPAMLRALADIEPHPHWRENVLRSRRACYAQRQLHELSADAERDWKEWESTTPRSLIESSSGH